jgi:hypothetical protein
MYRILIMSGAWPGVVSCCGSFLAWAARLTRGLSEWSLPDELVFSTVCALLRLASRYPNYRERVVAAIVTFAEESVKMLGEEPGMFALHLVLAPHLAIS